MHIRNTLLDKNEKVFHKNIFNTANEKINMCMLSGWDPDLVPEFVVEIQDPDPDPRYWC
jgi:hypothetical protein